MTNIQTFDNSIDVLKVIPWEYDQAPNLVGLLTKKQEWYKENYSDFWDAWEKNIFNLDTANDFGLNVWSIILDLPLYTRDDSRPLDHPSFGFSPFGVNFDQPNSQFAISSNAFKNLTIEQRRQLLKLRWYNITSDGTMACINQALYNVFGSTVYCLDGEDMTITYIFTEPQAEIMMNLFGQFDILPRPSGVLAKILVKPREAFGFADYGVNFDQPKSQFGS